MKAIVTNVKKGSSCYKYSGLTFEVKEILIDIVCLLIYHPIHGICSVDFSFKEVTIVDIQFEYQKAFDFSNWDSSGAKKLNVLNEYIHVKGIKLSIPEYTCPA